MRFRWSQILIVTTLLVVSCKESLPPRVSPASLFNLNVTAYYNYTPAANDVVIHAVMVNHFDETLNGRAGVSGSLLVTSARDTSVHKTIQLSGVNIIHANYNAITDTLTVDPGDSVVIEAAWDFTEDNGRNLNQTEFFQYSVDRTCQQRMIASPELFFIASKIRLFENLGYATFETNIEFQHYNIFVGPRDCIPM